MTGDDLWVHCAEAKTTHSAHQFATFFCDLIFNLDQTMQLSFCNKYTDEVGRYLSYEKYLGLLEDRTPVVLVSPNNAGGLMSLDTVVSFWGG